MNAHSHACDEILEKIKESASLPSLSPSAPYEMRATAIKYLKEHYPADTKVKWWEVYPEGQLAALAFRTWRALGWESWEEKNFELG